MSNDLQRSALSISSIREPGATESSLCQEGFSELGHAEAQEGASLGHFFTRGGFFHFSSASFSILLARKVFVLRLFMTFASLRLRIGVASILASARQLCQAKFVRSENEGKSDSHARKTVTPARNEKLRILHDQSCNSISLTSPETIAPAS